MRSRPFTLVCLLAIACGGEAGVDQSRRSSDAPGSIGHVPPGGAGGSDVVAPPSPPPIDEPPEEPPPFDDPGCPDIEPPPLLQECDALASPSGCPQGEACFPFVDYPSGPCEVERFGTMCRPAGEGVQGQSCSRGGCAADHVCVSTGRGTHCVRLCLLDSAEAVCAPGLLCLPIDIQGFGGCL